MRWAQKISKPWRIAALVAASVLLIVGVWVAYAGRDHPVVKAVVVWKHEADVERVLGLNELIRPWAEESGVDPYLIAGVLFSESRGVSGQTSHAGALGLMQLSHAAAGDAAARLGLPKPTESQLLNDDKLNVRLGSAHLKWLIEHRGDWSMEAVLVSYNAGRAKLKRWIAEKGSYAAWCASEEEAEAAGKRSTGALLYARRSLEMADDFRRREMFGK